jgi:hypothetical protein
MPDGQPVTRRTRRNLDISGVTAHPGIADLGSFLGSMRRHARVFKIAQITETTSHLQAVHRSRPFAFMRSYHSLTAVTGVRIPYGTPSDFK